MPGLCPAGVLSQQPVEGIQPYAVIVGFGSPHPPRANSGSPHITQPLLLILGCFGGNFRVLQVPPSLLPPLWGPPSRGTSGTPAWRSVGSPIPTHSAIQQGADLGKLRGGWGGRGGGGFKSPWRHGDDSRHGEAAWPGPLPWRCAWHDESPWRWPMDGVVPVAGARGRDGAVGWGGRGPTVGPRGGRAPSRCAWVGAVRRRVPPPPGFICTRLFHSSSHYHLTSPTSHFQSNHSTALIAHANMQIRIN